MTTSTMTRATNTTQIDSLTSHDGTKISYYTIGEGPGLVLLSGGNHAARHYLPLANHLPIFARCMW